MTDFPELNPEDVVERTEVIEHPPASTERGAARRVALQILYEVDSTQHPFAQVTVVSLNANRLSKRSERYVRHLVRGIHENRATIDALIQRHATEFPVAQMAIIDRNILRVGIYELADRPTQSLVVLIDEALELANLFGSEGSGSFINGVLGKVAAEDQDAIRQILPAEPESEDD